MNIEYVINIIFLNLFTADALIASNLLDKVIFFFQIRRNEAHDVQLIKIRSWMWIRWA